MFDDKDSLEKWKNIKTALRSIGYASFGSSGEDYEGMYSRGYGYMTNNAIIVVSIKRRAPVLRVDSRERIDEIESLIDKTVSAINGAGGTVNFSDVAKLKSVEPIIFDKKVSPLKAKYSGVGKVDIMGFRDIEFKTIDGLKIVVPVKYNFKLLSVSQEGGIVRLVKSFELDVK